MLCALTPWAAIVVSVNQDTMEMEKCVIVQEVRAIVCIICTQYTVTHYTRAYTYNTWL